MNGQSAFGSAGGPLRRMTQKKQQIADAKLQDPQATSAQIAERTGASKRSVDETLRRPEVMLYMGAFLDKAGATRAKTARVVSESMDAVKTKFFAKDGVVTDSREVIDHDVRLKGAELASKLRGDIQAPASNMNDALAELSDEQLAAVALGHARVGDFIEMKSGAAGVYEPAP